MMADSKYDPSATAGGSDSDKGKDKAPAPASSPQVGDLVRLNGGYALVLEEVKAQADTDDKDHVQVAFLTQVQTVAVDSLDKDGE